MREVKVGIAYEGGVDAEVIAVILRRLMEQSGLTFKDFDPATPGTAIVEFVPTYTKRFIENAVDIGVFCTDQDHEETKRRGEIEAKIVQVDEAFLLKSVIGVAVPHIEAWLLLDQDVPKRLLGIDATKPLPHADSQPKARLISMYSESDTYDKSLADLKKEIAAGMNITLCTQRSTDFKRFVQDIRSVIGRL